MTARPITVSAVTDSKVYDGDTSSNKVPVITSGTLVGTDSKSFSQSFGSASVGTGKTLTAAGRVVDGNNGDNYAVTFVTNTTGEITARAITVKADAQSQVYGAAAQALSYSITSGSLAAGDSFSGSLVRVAGGNVGTYAISKGTLAVNDNYTLSFVGADYTITARPITVSAVTDSNGYGGETVLNQEAGVNSGAVVCDQFQGVLQV